MRGSLSFAGSDTRVAWQPWSASAFDAARREDKLVVLFVTVSWCSTCAALEHTEFERPDIVALVRERFVPVRVNAAARPDISDRYVAEGWPTVAGLTPTAYPLIASTPTTADELLELLAAAAEGFDARRTELIRSVPNARVGGPHTPEVDAHDFDSAAEGIVDLAMASYDPVYAGFGSAPKIPHGSLLELLLTRIDDDERIRHLVSATLDAILDRLRDPADGGFFRAARDRDWSSPDAAKLIEVQAELMSLFAVAGLKLGVPRYLEAARDTAAFAARWMADRLGGFTIDDGLYVDANALMARALLVAGRALEDRALVEQAVITLEHVVGLAYRPGAGMSHEADERAPRRALLTDQVITASALTYSAAETGLLPHLMLAQELMLYAARVMSDARGGAFRDRAPRADDVGLLTEPLFPFALNCEAARVWLRLAALAEQPEYRQCAVRALASQTGAVARQGLFAAPYALAVQDLRAYDAGP